jgi:hypothetical protein
LDHAEVHRFLLASLETIHPAVHRGKGPPKPARARRGLHALHSAMTSTARETQAVLGDGLGGLACREGPGGTVVIDGVAPESWLSTWQLARDALDVYRRGPVATHVWETTSYSEPGWIEPERFVDEEIADVAPDQVAAFRAAALTAQPWSVFPLDARDYELPEGHLQYNLPPALPLEEALRDLRAPYTTATVSRYLFERLLQEPHLYGDGDIAWFASQAHWFVPDNVSLVLLPTTDSWMGGCWLGFHGALDPRRRAALAAAERAWLQRWGAERTASWLTMLQLVAAGPVADPEEAWTAAGQILAVASSNQEGQWRLALALQRDRFWFLHDRP